MVKVKIAGSRGLTLGTLCLAGIVTALGLWQYGGLLLPSPAPKTSYANICDDPGKIGSPVTDVPLPRHLYQAVDVAEGDNAASMAARAHINTALLAGNDERLVRNLLTTVYYKLAVSRSSLVEFVANCGYFGRNTVGASEAAQAFLGKPVSDVTLGEAALLAGLLKGPHSYDPARYPVRARRRRDMILEKMLSTGKIAQADLTAAKLEPVTPAQAGTQ